MLLWVMVTGCGNSPLVKSWTGEMSIESRWELDVQGAERERWATSNGWYHVD